MLDKPLRGDIDNLISPDPEMIKHSPRLAPSQSAVVEYFDNMVSALHLVGGKGDTGDTGLRGDSGGPKGDSGDQGLKGDTGDKGDTGNQGIKGDSGDQGLKGDTGTKGDTGEKGDTGSKGNKGDTGDQGLKGDSGESIKGDTGNRGIQGLRGDTGSDQAIEISFTPYGNIQSSDVQNALQELDSDKMPLSYLDTTADLGNSNIKVPSQKAVKDFGNNLIKNYKNLMSTALISGGILTVNDLDKTKMDISGGIGVVVDNYADPENPTVKVVTWSDSTSHDDPFLSESSYTSWGIDINGKITTKNGDFDDEDRRNIIILGWSDHAGGDVENLGYNQSYFGNNVYSQFIDLANSIGNFNISGNDIEPIGGLQIARSSGKVFEVGSNYPNSILNPNIFTSDLNSPTELYYYYRSAPGVWFNDNTSSFEIDPNFYDSGNGLLEVPDGKFTIQVITYYSSQNVLDIQYGQSYYNTMELALAASQVPNIEFNPYNQYDVVRAWLIVKKGTVELENNLTEAVFIPAGRFGTVTGSGGGARGEINTGGNIGLAGTGVYSTKVGLELKFRNIRAKSNKTTVEYNDTFKTVDIDSEFDVKSGSILPTSIYAGMEYRQITTGRDWVLECDGTDWNVVSLSGNLFNFYINSTNGVDDFDHGMGVNTDAFKTINYLFELLGNVNVEKENTIINIYLSNETYTSLPKDYYLNLTGFLVNINIFGSITELTSGETLNTGRTDNGLSLLDSTNTDITDTLVSAPTQAKIRPVGYIGIVPWKDYRICNSSYTDGGSLIFLYWQDILNYEPTGREYVLYTTDTILDSFTFHLSNNIKMNICECGVNSLIFYGGDELQILGCRMIFEMDFYLMKSINMIGNLSTSDDDTNYYFEDINSLLFSFNYITSSYYNFNNSYNSTINIQYNIVTGYEFNLSKVEVKTLSNNSFYVGDSDGGYIFKLLDLFCIISGMTNNGNDLYIDFFNKLDLPKQLDTKSLKYIIGGNFPTTPYDGQEYVQAYGNRKIFFRYLDYKWIPIYIFGGFRFYVDNVLGVDNLENGWTDGIYAFKTLTYVMNLLSKVTIIHDPGVPDSFIFLSNGFYDEIIELPDIKSNEPHTIYFTGVKTSLTTGTITTLSTNNISSDVDYICDSANTNIVDNVYNGKSIIIGTQDSGEDFYRNIGGWGYAGYVINKSNTTSRKLEFKIVVDPYIASSSVPYEIIDITTRIAGVNCVTPMSNKIHWKFSLIDFNSTGSSSAPYVLYYANGVDYVFDFILCNFTSIGQIGIWLQNIVNNIVWIKSANFTELNNNNYSYSIWLDSVNLQTVNTQVIGPKKSNNLIPVVYAGNYSIFSPQWSYITGGNTDGSSSSALMDFEYFSYCYVYNSRFIKGSENITNLVYLNAFSKYVDGGSYVSGYSNEKFDVLNNAATSASAALSIALG